MTAPAHAKTLLTFAMDLVNRGRAQFGLLGVGVTVIVHDATTHALGTTAASRFDARLVLMQALFGSLMADGVTEENLPDVLERETAVLFERGLLRWPGGKA
jgi:hypothetical protein